MKAGELVIDAEGMIANGIFWSPIEVPRGTEFLVRAFGVTIGKASVVTSGSVVVTNVPSYSMVQGNPAKVIKQFPKPEGP